MPQFPLTFGFDGMDGCLLKKDFSMRELLQASIAVHLLTFSGVLLGGDGWHSGWLHCTAF